ncbi:hypothetical protein FCH28_03010 [Streptomyces piniterrae]|uniref:Aminoacyl-transfer RNA synthetases class-II family profile domain-containing protein n=1 Tax=Streptomyces piniterrae TaxID=2571125 RepID=A0A4U0P8Q4_9ACTN|nr:amino acid--tRNA ligase-related protein [Streptomyces piniterrae]TJZ59114.1 hypothetical protein FCH28_03010 [Streptomyces piniterrae]
MAITQPTDVIRGWIEEIRPARDGGGRTELLVRGGGTVHTITAEPALLPADGLSAQSVVEVTVDESGDLPRATALRVVSEALPLPVDLRNPDLTDLDHRHLHIRSRQLRASATLRHHVQKYVREFLDAQGCHLVQTPILTSASSVSSGAVFQVPYYGGQTASLPQSNWMYADAMVSALERVYTFGPTFRREDDADGIHLVEIWQVSADFAWATYQDLMAIEEEMLRHVAIRLRDEHADVYALAGLPMDHLDAITKPFARISYADSVTLLRDLGHDFTYGADYTKEQSDAISSTFDRPYFITGFPKELKNFWFPVNEDGTTPTSDLFAHTGQGEIIGGGERAHQAEEMIAGLRRRGYDLAKFEWLVDIRRYGCTPHAGFSMGFDRLVAMYLGAEDIRNAVLFPRVPHEAIKP